MSSWKHSLGGVAAFGLVALLHPELQVAASLAARDGMGRAPAGPLERVVFHGHSTTRHFLLLLSAKLLVVLSPLYDGE